VVVQKILSQLSDSDSSTGKEPEMFPSHDLETTQKEYSTMAVLKVIGRAEFDSFIQTKELK
jgi:hypothetical protein